MPRFTHTETVAAAPSAIWAILADVRRTPEWLARCTQLDTVDDSPLVVGSRLKYHYREGNRTGVMDGAVEVYEPERRLTNRFTDKMMDVTVDFAMSAGAAAATTDLTHTIVITPKGLLGRLLSPLIAKQLPGQTMAAMKSLKVLAEQG